MLIVVGLSTGPMMNGYSLVFLGVAKLAKLGSTCVLTCKVTDNMAKTWSGHLWNRALYFN